MFKAFFSSNELGHLNWLHLTTIPPSPAVWQGLNLQYEDWEALLRSCQTLCQALPHTNWRQWLRHATFTKHAWPDSGSCWQTHKLPAVCTRACILASYHKQHSELWEGQKGVLTLYCVRFEEPVDQPPLHIKNEQERETKSKKGCNKYPLWGDWTSWMFYWYLIPVNRRFLAQFMAVRLISFHLALRVFNCEG